MTRKQITRALLCAVLAGSLILPGCGLRSLLGAGNDGPAVVVSGKQDNGLAHNSAPTMTYESYVAADGGMGAYYYVEEPGIDEPLPFNTEEYNVLKEHGFTSVASLPYSTFAADVDTASYCNLRRMINDGYKLEDIPDGAVRVEEMLNYFKYDYVAPKNGELFGISAQVGDCPWNDQTKLLVMTLFTDATVPESAGNNFVFLIDVSGSMSGDDKLPLLQKSFSYLLDQLDDEDNVSIVTYSGQERVVLDGAKVKDRKTILKAIRSLEANGYTNGQAGMAKAYELAEKHYIKGGNNRIILASDGDLNEGITSASDLSEFVSQKRESGIYLSVLGFGAGNYKDSKMEAIADDGNGCYYYIDCLEEAERIFGEDLTSTLYTVADDVKLQVEFNPAYVKAYRQIGYENRELATDEFEDDSVDAGEVGAGHSITVAYELVMNDSQMELFTSDSRYGNNQAAGVQNGEWFNLSVRYKEPGGKVATQRDYPMGEDVYVGAAANASDDWKFASCVIEFAMLCNDSENMGDTTAQGLLETLAGMDFGTDERREEFSELVDWLLG
ncbi:MAG: VWA domain-containing protein [Coriobacteriales bacterium]|nr:VWA domain-containing protein [Coriobacteriales bacterium]